MKRKTLKFLPLLLIVCFLANTNSAMAAASNQLDAVARDTAEYIAKTVQAPQVGTIGGEWAVFSLARSGYEVPTQYYQDYYDAVCAYVKTCKGNLHEKKYTEYSRLILALTAIGKDPADVAGYNLLIPLGDYEKTVWQGVNGPIWALIALDSGNYTIPKNPNAKIQATRERYIQRILDCRLPDGGWSLLGDGTAAQPRASDPDITGMALQALANYQNQADVKKATTEALACMSKQQNQQGGFTMGGAENFESCVQMLTALGELGIPMDDPRFIKENKTLLDNLLSFYIPHQGFSHAGKASNQMSSEQGLYGLVAAQRLRDNKPSLYCITDPVQMSASGEKDTNSGGGLNGKNPGIQRLPIVYPGKTFADIAGNSAHKNQRAIEALAARGMMGGKTNTTFAPNETMTRAEFAATVVRALGLPPKAVNAFADVPATAWYAPAVGTAYTMGIVSGRDATHFNPYGTITCQEAAVMIARAAKLCGMETAYSTAAARDVLAQFTDYVESGEWARSALAFCCAENILPQDQLELSPTHPMQRCEIAQMVFQLLTAAELL